MRALRTVRECALIVSVGARIYARDAPWRVVVSTHWTRSILETLLYTGIGFVAAGEAGANYAYVGATALVLIYYCVAMATDIPMRDKWDGTFYRSATTRWPTSVLFVLKAVPNIGHGVLAALVSALAVGIMTGRQPSLILGVMACAPLILVGAFSCVMGGLLVVAPAIGTRLDAVTYNTLGALIVVLSGAVVPQSSLGWLQDVASILPLTHTIDAMRSALIGRPFGSSLLVECVVALTWGVALSVTYAFMKRRGVISGRGAFVG